MKISKLFLILAGSGWYLGVNKQTCLSIKMLLCLHFEIQILMNLLVYVCNINWHFVNDIQNAGRKQIAQLENFSKVLTIFNDEAPRNNESYWIKVL